MKTTYHHWRIIGTAKSRNHQGYVLARCKCGTQREVALWSLTRGHSKSCGCLTKGPERINPIGMRFGKLVVVRKLGADVIGQCECGRKKRVRLSNLTSGNTRSCGCGRSRRGAKIFRGKESVVDLCRRLGISRATYYARQRKAIRP